jgi:hypothetical protein
MPFARLALSGTLPIALLAGCAPQGDFPSLAPRPVEKAFADSAEEPVRPVAADDPALPARLDTFVAAGRRGQADFDGDLEAARKAVARAGTSGSDSWIQAQQAISRVEAARSATANALADLDAFAIEQAKAHPLSPSDQDRIRRASEQLQAIAREQEEAVAALKSRLGG